MHLAKTHDLPFSVFTLDTGLLFPETLELKSEVESFLGRPILSLVPDYTPAVQAQYFGEELWKREPDFCCSLRKVVPLQSHLKTLDCWITGLRREQSGTRQQTGVLEVYRMEDGRAIAKLNPMAKWGREAVWAYIREHGLPYHPLHDRGYRSIGCQPCTLPSENGDERAGRWTGFKKTECGIHTFMTRVDVASLGDPTI